MTSGELRKSFLDFFKSQGHAIVPSSSLIPDDPSVLLTTAGMQQFKPYYTGEADAMKDFGSQRTASVQKSFRTSDIDEVGDETHLTFFEMLGNFSFGPVGADDPEDKGTGGYFKRSSIYWAYEYFTKHLGLKIDYVTIFEGDDKTPRDDESEHIWQELGIKDIREDNREENFWGPTGSEGPCGPTTEIFINGVEVWNIVFNEYYCRKCGRLDKLENPGVDTGMGFERLLTIVQNKQNLFETDVFAPIIDLINREAPKMDMRVKRIVADHMRGTCFLVADGVDPSNLDRGYIVRRHIRRAYRFGKMFNLPREAYDKIIDLVADVYGDDYPEVRERKDYVHQILGGEIDRFAKTIERGMKEFEKIAKAGITGKEAFYLYESFGFPYELTQELAKEKGVEISKGEFDRELEAHQEKSRQGQEKKFGGHGLILDTGELKAGSEEEMEKVLRLHTVTHLLQAALRKVLGEEAKQMGSDITPDRTRFDFTFPRKLTDEEKQKIEEIVNEAIKKDLKVEMKEMPYEEALKSGALSFFKEKYPEKVKVYSVIDEKTGEAFSRELCGGPHVERTGQIGHFRIKKEESVAAGVRRIRGVVDR